MDTKTVGIARLRGWRSTVANVTAGPVARRSPLSEDQVKAAVGAVFLVLSIMYVLAAVKDVIRSRD